MSLGNSETAQRPMGALMTTDQAAAYLGVSMRTLEAWRSQGHGGPPFRKIGRRLVRYHPNDLDEFSANGVRANTGQS